MQSPSISSSLSKTSSRYTLCIVFADNNYSTALLSQCLLSQCQLIAQSQLTAHNKPQMFLPFSLSGAVSDTLRICYNHLPCDLVFMPRQPWSEIGDISGSIISMLCNLTHILIHILILLVRELLVLLTFIELLTNIVLKLKYKPWHLLQTSQKLKKSDTDFANSIVNNQLMYQPTLILHFYQLILCLPVPFFF